MTQLSDFNRLLAGGPLFDHDPRRAGALMSLLQLRWFVRLRWALVAVALAVLALERFVTPDAVRPGALVVPILALAILNLVWMGVQDVLEVRFRQPGAEESRTIRNAQALANAQVGTDLFLLTVILRYTGGVENPMALFYLFHMGIGALLLRPWHAVLQGCWAIALYATLAMGEYGGWIAPHWEFLPQFPRPGLHTRGEYVSAVISVMVCGIFATLYFTLHITSRLNARERQLRTAYDTLRHSEAAIFDLQQRRSRFLRTAAHQLKSPLASIETLVTLLLDRIVPPEALTPTYEKIRQRCREGVHQVGELLTLARVQRADPRRHRRSVADVGLVAAEVCARYRVLAEGRGVELRYAEPPPGAFTAYVDPADLTDCLGNLVDNAIKFTPEHGTVTISVAHLAVPEQALAHAADEAAESWQSLPQNEQDWVCVSVCDTGIGLDPKALAEARDPEQSGSIFDAFRRGNNALAAGIPGTGLGLTIVREVVEQAGGRIILRPRHAGGTCFAVVFPAREHLATDVTIRETRTSLTVLDAVDTPAEPEPAGMELEPEPIGTGR